MSWSDLPARSERASARRSSRRSRRRASGGPHAQASTSSTARRVTRGRGWPRGGARRPPPRAARGHPHPRPRAHVPRRPRGAGAADGEAIPLLERAYHGWWRLRETEATLRLADAALFLNGADRTRAVRELGVEPARATSSPTGSPTPSRDSRRRSHAKPGSRSASCRSDRGTRAKGSATPLPPSARCWRPATTRASRCSAPACRRRRSAPRSPPRRSRGSTWSSAMSGPRCRGCSPRTTCCCSRAWRRASASRSWRAWRAGSPPSRRRWAPPPTCSRTGARACWSPRDPPPCVAPSSGC